MLKKVRVFLCLSIALLLCFGSFFSTFAYTQGYDGMGPVVISGGKRDFKWPVPGYYNIQSCFYDTRNHCAIDISAPLNTSAVAAYTGKVIKAVDGGSNYYGDGFGNYVVLQHTYQSSNGTISLYSRYSHLNSVSVREGAVVSAGAEVGKIGTSGKSDGYHLDFQILYGNWQPYQTYSIDPYANQLLELPSNIVVYDSWPCGTSYLSLVKELYSQPLVSESTTILYPTSGSVYKIAYGGGNNMYLDFSCNSNNVQIYENCDGHSDPAFVISQYFKLTHIGDGWYTIINIGNGKCVDIENTNPASGTNIMQWDCYPNDGQLYRFYDAGNGYCYIKSKLGTYVDKKDGDTSNETNVWSYEFNGSVAQKWKLELHSHSYTSTITTNPTCKTDGIKTYKCFCGDSYTQNIGKHAATHEGGTEIKNTRESTCKDAGYTGDTYCKGCGLCLGFGTSIAKKEHSWEAATCTVAKTCSVCKETEGTVLGHNYIQRTYKWDFSKFPYMQTSKTCDRCWRSSIYEEYEFKYSTDFETNCGVDYVEIIWNDRFVDREFYEVNYIDIYQYDEEQGCYKLIQIVDDSLKSYKVTGLNPGTEYKFCIVAHPLPTTEGDVWYVFGGLDMSGEYMGVITAKTNCGHKNTNIIEAIDSTCSSIGYVAGVYCNDCQKYISGHKEIAINPANHVNTKNVPETPATFENVGYTAGVYCNDCKKYISGHVEIPKLMPEFTDSKDAKESGNNIVSNNGLTVAQLLSQAGKGAVIKTADGKSVENAALIGTGMILTMADGSKKEIVVYGDSDGDGKISAADARLALRASVKLESYKEDSCYYKAANVDKDALTAADARLILRASVGLEEPKDWMK